MLITRILREPPDNLSEVELAFWRRLTFGECPRDIGKGLGLGQEAALSVQRSLLEKLGVSRVVEAVREGIYAGLQPLANSPSAGPRTGGFIESSPLRHSGGAWISHDLFARALLLMVAGLLLGDLVIASRRRDERRQMTSERT